MMADAANLSVNGLKFAFVSEKDHYSYREYRN